MLLIANERGGEQLSCLICLSPDTTHTPPWNSIGRGGGGGGGEGEEGASLLILSTRGRKLPDGIMGRIRARVEANNRSREIFPYLYLCQDCAFPFPPQAALTPPIPTAPHSTTHTTSSTSVEPRSLTPNRHIFYKH